jgi:two-component system OmpR family sensor kinase
MNTIRAWLRRQSLRRRLLAVILLVTALVLGTAGVVTTEALSAFLFNRVDDQLHQTSEELARALVHNPRDPLLTGLADTGALGFVFTPDGADAQLLGAPTDTTSVDAFNAVPQDGYPHDVSAPRGSYRVLATRLPDGTVLLAAQSRGPIDETLGRLVAIEVAVAIAGLAAACIAGWVLTRVTLRPLERMTSTTRRIAATDLTGPGAASGLRVPDWPPSTELGQLSSGMNHMLDAIGRAFADRDEAQDKLRRFIADASHELRTPLSTVRGYAELFHSSVRSNTDLQVAMRRIESESERMGVLVDDLLLLARLDQGRPLERQDVDLCRLAVDAASDFRVTDHERPIQLDVPPEPLIVAGDEHRLWQVIVNLLANVHAHTPPGTTVDLSVAGTADGAAIAVHDTGPGIPPDSADRIFDRFYRTDPSRSRSSGGTGLGLSIVQAIVTAHGGRITVDSVPGSTRMHVELPNTQPTVE